MPEDGRRRLFITGGRGLIGRHVIDAAGDDWIVLAPPSTDVDIRDAAQVDRAVSAHTPDVVLHLAYRRDDPAVIVDGSRNVARSAAAAGARLIHMSTDLVFAGRDRPYTEHDPADARLEYGRHKLRAEQEVVSAHPAAVVVRTSLVYGLDPDGPVLRDVVGAIAGDRPMAFFDDEVRCPVFAGDLARCLLDLAGRTTMHGVLHLAGPEAVSRADLARTIALHLGADPALVPISSIAASGLDRPTTVVLDSTRAADAGLRVRGVSAVLGSGPAHRHVADDQADTGGTHR